MRLTFPVANEKEAAPSLRHPKIGRIEHLFAYEILAPESLQEIWVAAPVPHLDNVLDHDPTWVEDLREVQHIPGRAAAILAPFLASLSAGVIRAFRRSQQKMDWANVGEAAPV
jgi:hypothetical protein